MIVSLLHRSKLSSLQIDLDSQRKPLFERFTYYKQPKHNDNNVSMHKLASTRFRYCKNRQLQFLKTLAYQQQHTQRFITP